MNLKNGEGEIVRLGLDSRGNKVYALSIKGDRKMVYRLIDSFLKISDLSADELYLVDNCPGDNILLLIGSAFCRSVLLAPLGRFLAVAGIKKKYLLLSQTVNLLRGPTSKA